MLDQLPTCYLNVCALYSTLGLHAEALKHAFLALQILRELIRNIDNQVWMQWGVVQIQLLFAVFFPDFILCFFPWRSFHFCWK